MPAQSPSALNSRSYWPKPSAPLILFLAVVICLMGGIAYAAFGRWSLEAVQDRVALSTQGLASVVDNAIRFDAERIYLGLSLVAGVLQQKPRAAASGSSRQMLARVQQRLGLGTHLFVMSPDGEPLFAPSSDAAQELLASVRELWRRCRDIDCSTPRVSDPEPDPTAKRRYVLFYQKYNAPKHGPGGLVAVALPVQELSRILGKVPVGAKGIALLRDSRYRVVSREPPSTNPNEQPGMAKFSSQLRSAMDSRLVQETLLSSKTGDGIARLESYRRVRGLPFHLVIGMARREYLGAWRKTMWWAGFWLAGFCAVVLGGAALLARALRRQAGEAALNTALLRSITDGMFVLDESDRILQVSESMCHILGFSEKELIGAHLQSIRAPGSPCLPDASGMAAGTRVAFEGEYLDRSGQARSLEGLVFLHTSHGRRIRFVSARDVTERKLAEQQLRTTAVAFQAQQGMIVCDLKGLVLQVNESFLAITGLSRDKLIGQPAPCLHPSVLTAEKSGEIDNALKHEGHWEGEVTLHGSARGEIHLWLSRSAVRDESGRITHYVSSYSRAAPAKEAGRRLLEMAYYDELTGLPNRSLLRARVEDALTGKQRPKQHGALLMFDLDFFKSVNDSQGHDAGDVLLVEVARRARRALRSSDTLARLGGDEFVVLAQGLGECDEAATAAALQIADKLRDAIASGVMLGHEVFYPTCSVGITLFGCQVSTFENLLKQADLALYAAKAAGRNTVRSFCVEMQAAADRHARLLSGIHTALAAGEFTMYYQPQVDVTGRVCGAEALLRWESPSRGLVSPGEFVGIAEESGLIAPLGLWALKCVCAQLASWSEDDVLSRLTVAVNVSPRQLRKKSFSQDVAQILQSTGVAPGRLKLEVTESATLDETAVVVRNVEDLRALGLSLSVDDFGTGYASLANLLRLPFDQLKIDKSFIDDIAHRAESRAMVRAIVSLAGNLGLGVIAEGVESREQLLHLVQAGCTAFQGYLFAKPMSGAAFTRYARYLVCAGHEIISPGNAHAAASP